MDCKKMPSNDSIYKIVIRVPKRESAFTYFTLEANEGIGFYSTLPFEKGDMFRDIEITCSISLKSELEHIVEVLGKAFPIEFL